MRSKLGELFTGLVLLHAGSVGDLEQMQLIARSRHSPTRRWKLSSRQRRKRHSEFRLEKVDETPVGGDIVFIETSRGGETFTMTVCLESASAA